MWEIPREKSVTPQMALAFRLKYHSDREQGGSSHKPGIIEFVSAVPRTEVNIPKALNE